MRLADRLYAEPGPDGSERLFAHDEVRLVATVELAGWQLRSIRAGERLRRGPTFVDAPWQSREDSLGGFSGRSLGGGMARYCLERLGERKEDALLLSTLLSLAPGMTQVGVAVSDVLAPSSASRPGGLAPAGPGPCYMLRTDGPLMETISSGRSRPEAGPKS